ncbi:hypothetical protein P8452_23172 [Trifolium repens]|nr:hypothetical protein P8452_23172 [Trifolium repens]
MSWLTGWITSCFLSCFLPCKNDHERVSSPRVIVRNMTFDKRKNENFNNIHDNNLSQSITTCNNVHQNDDSSWSFFSDDDFIVYGFEEDGPFDIVKDDKGMHKYARPVLLKGEGEEKEIKHNHEVNKGRVYHAEINEDYEIMSVESRNSIQSGDSSRSFAFPVLDCEWIGTPE